MLLLLAFYSALCVIWFVLCGEKANNTSWWKKCTEWFKNFTLASCFLAFIMTMEALRGNEKLQWNLNANITKESRDGKWNLKAFAIVKLLTNAAEWINCVIVSNCIYEEFPITLSTWKRQDGSERKIFNSRAFSKCLPWGCLKVTTWSTFLIFQKLRRF